MKLCTKRIYCPDCRRLVRGREETINSNTHRVLCGRCGRPLWFWNGITWRYLGKETIERQSRGVRGGELRYEAAEATSAK
jgi:hypothetical protein